MSRTKSSIVNVITAFIGQGFGFIISFIARIFFIKILGEEYLGINGLFTNILTVLSLAELGVGTAITYSLYEPLAKKDIEKCKSLMWLYKKIYIIIGIVIICLGISITPFLNVFVKETPNIDNLRLIYILFVLNSGISYFYSYKRNLIIADQNRYIATIYRYSFYFILNILQIIYLITYKNYIGFLIIQIIFTFLENYFVSKKANKMYPFLLEKNVKKVDKITKKEIVKNTKAMMMHRIGSTIVSSTDNIILSKFVGLVEVGLYSNYYLILYALNLITVQIYNSLVPGIGNLKAENNVKKEYEVFKKLNFITFWMYSFLSLCLLVLFNDFISLWIGGNYILNFNVVLVLVIIFYLTGMRKSVLAFRDAMGLFYVDRYKALLEALINIIASIFLAIKFGILGVFLGTLISSITTCVWIEPFVLYKYGFKMKFIQYCKDYLKQLTIVIIMGIMLLLLQIMFGNYSIILRFVINFIICVFGINIVFWFIFKNTEEFIYFKDMFVKIIKKVYKKKKCNLK